MAKAATLFRLAAPVNCADGLEEAAVAGDEAGVAAAEEPAGAEASAVEAAPEVTAVVAAAVEDASAEVDNAEVDNAEVDSADDFDAELELSEAG
jgi:hypothetical protein